MRKELFLALAFVAPMAASPAMALPTSRTLAVSFDGAVVGHWSARNKVSETDQVCRYTLRWTDLAGPPLSRTALCRIEEYKAGDNFDCEVNRRTFFDTLIVKGSGDCHGFDDFGQQTNITTLVAGEGADGVIEGIVESASVSDVQNFQVR